MAIPVSSLTTNSEFKSSNRMGRKFVEEWWDLRHVQQRSSRCIKSVIGTGSCKVETCLMPPTIRLPGTGFGVEV